MFVYKKPKGGIFTRPIQIQDDQMNMAEKVELDQKIHTDEH